MFKKENQKQKSKIQPPPLRPHLTLTLLLEFLKKRKEREKGKRKIFSFLLLLLVHSPLSIVPRPLFSQVPTVPHLLNFQSVLTDPAGLPLSDGMHQIIFRIVDAQGVEGYKETQNLESVHGVVSAMVGNQGELGLTMFDPQVPKFLGVQVDGGGPETLLEIASVPYAMTAEQALSVAPQSISAEAIKPRAITADLLADDVAGQLLTRLQTGGAVQIGVSNTFVYSQGTTMEGVIKDLDTAVYQRQINMDRFRSDLQSKVDATNGRVDSANANIDVLQTDVSNTKTDIGDLQTANLNISASVSADKVTTDGRLASLERSVDQITALPKIMAAGVVNVGNGGASVSGGYNVSGASLNGRRVTVSFASTVLSPYMVLTTPVSDVAGMAPGNAPVVLISAISSGSFEVNTNWASMPSFHFVVFK